MTLVPGYFEHDLHDIRILYVRMGGIRMLFGHFFLFALNRHAQVCINKGSI